MNIIRKQLLMDAFGWGFGLWFIGYALGMILFPFVPNTYLGWVIMPIGTIITLWVLWKKISQSKMRDYAYIALVWTAIAVICDHLFLVKALKIGTTYYKPDVYIYYCLTFLLPLTVWWWKNRTRSDIPTIQT